MKALEWIKQTTKQWWEWHDAARGRRLRLPAKGDIDPLAMYERNIVLRRYIAVLTAMVFLLVTGWFLTNYIIPSDAEEKLDRGRQERLEWQCRIEVRFDMDQESCRAMEDQR